MRKILIIEDETYIRSMYQEVLEEAGFQVFGVGDGQKGLEMIKNETWDLILLDIMLPSLDGTKILETMHSQKSPSPKVIIISNLNDQQLKDQCMDLGATAFIVKSNIIPDDLVDIVRTHVKPEEDKNI